MNSQHRYICSPTTEDKAAKCRRHMDVVAATLCIVIFAGIGMLLAWRG